MALPGASITAGVGHPHPRVCSPAMTDDRCPGALRLHPADDGHVARIRIPGGRLTAVQLAALADLADALGDGVLHLTSRGNLQVRGLSASSGSDVGTALAAAGLLPSLAHDRVRNVVASPHGGPDLDAALVAFDALLCADLRLTDLSGRFLFGLDDGSGDVLALAPDLAATPAGDGWELVVGGQPTRRHGDAAPLLTAAARLFLDLRDAHAPDAWRVTDLDPALLDAFSPSTRLFLTSSPQETAQLEAWVPLGSATTQVWRSVAGLADRVILTPWRSVVLPMPYDAQQARIALQDKGFSLDGKSATATTSACIGRPSCAKALADVRADALGLASDGHHLHVSGCERRCGAPRTPHLEAVATGAGYRIQER